MIDFQVRTYRGPATAGAPAVSGLAGVMRTEVSPATVLETERYDTADLRLAAAGSALSVVRGSAPAYWQLDLPDGVDTERLRVPAADEGPAGGRLRLPGEVAELVRGATRKQAVGPVGRVRTSRTEHRLLGTDDHVLAVLVHDHVTLATMGRTAQVEAWTEITVQAGAALVDALDTRVREAGMRPAEPLADAELARLLRPVPARPELPRRSAGASLTAYLTAQVDRIAAEDLRVRLGEPDAVHQLRIAARRLRSALQGYRTLLDQDRVEPLVTGLRELGRGLAPARDAEVLGARIGGALAALPTELRLGGVAALTTRHFARAGSEGAAAALTMLDGDDYTRLRDALDQLVADPPLSKRAKRPATKELRHAVRRSARRLQSTVDAAVASTGPERDGAVHAARKAGKRLRYVTEVARPVVGKPAERLIADAKAVQTALGEHQDTVMARVALRSLGAAAHTEHENGFSFGVLYGLESAAAARIEAGLPRLWAQAWRRTRHWVR